MSSNNTVNTVNTINMEAQKTACERVLDIAELVEAILIHLPIRELLTAAPLACRLFKATIEASHSIQKALHQLPVTSAPLYFNTPGSPIGGRFRGDEFFTSQNKALGRSTFGNRAEVVILHPVISWHQIPGSWGPNVQGLWNPEASWRKQLLTQPPIKSCQVFGRYHDTVTVTASDEKRGVTVGDFVEKTGWGACRWYGEQTLRGCHNHMDRPRWTLDTTEEFNARIWQYVDLKGKEEEEESEVESLGLS